MSETGATATDVLVVGAGPAGLTAALTLVKGGLDPIVVDVRPGPGGETKAVWLQPRALEIWHGLGAAEPVTSRGRPIEALRIHGIGDRPRELCLQADSQFAPHLAPQPRTEQALLDGLDNSGGSVQWGTRLVDLEVADTGLHSAVLERRDGTRVTLPARDIIGADGAKSTVRRSLSLSFQGRTHRQPLFVADVTGDLTLDRDVGHMFLTSDGACAVLPLSTRRWRVAGTTRRNGTAPSLHDLLRPYGSVKVLSGPTRHAAHIRWLSAQLPPGVALVGDAAHLHTPVGGQGLNLAVADAHAVAWRLVARSRGAALDVAMAAEERRAVAAGVRRSTELLFRLQTTAGPVASRIRVALFAIVTSPAFAESPLGSLPARILSQIGHVPCGGSLRTIAGHVGAPPWLSGGRLAVGVDTRDATRHLLLGVTPDARRPAPSTGSLRKLLDDDVLRDQVEVHGDVVSPAICAALGSSRPVVGLLRPDTVLIARSNARPPTSVVSALERLRGSARSVSADPRRRRWP